MEQKVQTSKEYFKILSILHSALLGGQLLFAMVVFYLNMNGQFSNDDSGEIGSIFQFLVPAIIVAGVFGSSVLFKVQLKSIKAKPELKDKLNDYRGASLIKYAMLEAPSMFAIVCYLLTVNIIFLGYAGLIIVLFLLNRPSPESAVNDLELNQSDKMKILDPNAIVGEVKQPNVSDD
jgi:hypothetical protein